MPQFTVKVQPRETGAPAFDINVNGHEILSQEDAEAHALKHSSGRYTIVRPPATVTDPDKHSA